MLYPLLDILSIESPWKITRSDKMVPRIPSGWWWTAVSTQPSVTLHHSYWSFENRPKLKKTTTGSNSAPVLVLMCFICFWHNSVDWKDSNFIKLQCKTKEVGDLSWFVNENSFGTWQVGLCGCFVGPLWVTANLRGRSKCHETRLRWTAREHPQRRRPLWNT